MTAPALVLEKLMSDPRWPEVVDQLRAATPSHVVDQADAATAATDTVMQGLAHLMRAESTGAAVVADIPGWLRLGALDTFTSWVAGTGTTCLHNPHPSSPQPVMAAAWRPALVTCGLCVRMFHTRPGSDLDRTCDCCGRICAGPDAADGIYPGAVQVAMLVYQYGACSDCHTPVARSVAPGEVLRQSPDYLRAKPRGGRGRARGRGRR